MYESLLSLLSTVFGHEVGSHEFNIVCAVSLCVMFLTARILVGLFGSKSGIIRCSLGMALPLVIGCLAYAMVEVNLVPELDAEWASLLPWMAFGLIAFGAILVLTRRLFGFGFVFSLFLYCMSAAFGFGGFIGSQAVVDVMDRSHEQLEEREDLIHQKIEDAH